MQKEKSVKATIISSLINIFYSIISWVWVIVWVIGLGLADTYNLPLFDWRLIGSLLLIISCLVLINILLVLVYKKLNWIYKKTVYWIVVSVLALFPYVCLLVCMISNLFIVA